MCLFLSLSFFIERTHAFVGGVGKAVGTESSLDKSSGDGGCFLCLWKCSRNTESPVHPSSHCPGLISEAGRSQAGF